MEQKNFDPLIFLSSLGAGGIAVMPFVIMQYTLEHGEGLITRSQLWSKGFNGITSGYFYTLEFIMILFVILHFVLTIFFSVKLIKWMKTRQFKELVNNPLKNNALLAPLISLLMTMNLFIGPIRYFFPIISNNFQSLFLPAMIFWSIIFGITILIESYLLSISFKKGFDVEKITFGWLLHPFLLGMLTTVGTGLAAMAKDSAIANTAAFMSMISGTMGIFLLSVKLIVLFKSHFTAKELPEKQFLPSFLIVIPNITLFAISAFRFGHFLENHHAFHMEAYLYMVIGLAFAFEIWYLIFGLFLLADYFKKYHFKEFYITQWGLICPLVAFVVLGAFAYSLIAPNILLYLLMIITMAIAISFYFELLFKQIKCSRENSSKSGCE
jgi:tellurite resistance protein TehA-like permease